MAAAGAAASKIHLSGIHSVVFDLDDTLYPERSYAFSGFEAVAAWLGDRLDCPFDAAARMRELFETESRRSVFNELLAELGCLDSERLVSLMIECYRNHQPILKLHHDAEDALSRWAGFQLGLISDGPLTMQRRKVEALGLPRRLDPVILTDAWGTEYWKPHLRAFQEMQDVHGTTGRACVYIGDNCAKDFVAPRRLGWQTVCIQRADGLYQAVPAPPGGHADHQVCSLDQLDISS